MTLEEFELTALAYAKQVLRAERAEASLAEMVQKIKELEAELKKSKEEK